MTSEVPSKADIATIFKRLRSIATNKQCFDCGAQNPTWASITYGVFLCIDCSAKHRGLGVHVTFIRSTQLDTNWTWEQLRSMQVGGNAAAVAFFRQHGCTTNDVQQKYHSRAANMYREKVAGLAHKALRQHGTMLHIDNPQMHTEAPSSPPAGAQEVDFFKEHEDFEITQAQSLSVSSASSQPVSIARTTNNGNQAEEEETGAEPNVESALSVSPTEASRTAEPRKATIGVRRPANTAKKGLGGAKKGGLGAQKVNANFSEIELAAQQKDKHKEQMEAAVVLSKEQEEKKMVSMKLAYQQLSVDEKKREEKQRAMDPKKAEQFERLGMGVGMGENKSISHSMMSDMKLIEQEKPGGSSSSLDKYMSRGRDEDDDGFTIISTKGLGGDFYGAKKGLGASNWSSGKSSWDSKPSWDNSFDSKPSWDKSDSSKASWDSKPSWDKDSKSSWDTSERFDSKQSTFTTNSIMTNSKTSDEKGRNRKTFEQSDSVEAQKKFGTAKAISSSQFFGDRDSNDVRRTLSSYEGKSSISSADLFGDGNGQRQQSSQGYGDFGDITDGMREGVTKVASKLSRIANGVMNSIQDG